MNKSTGIFKLFIVNQMNFRPNVATGIVRALTTLTNHNHNHNSKIQKLGRNRCAFNILPSSEYPLVSNGKMCVLNEIKRSNITILIEPSK